MTENPLRPFEMMGFVSAGVSKGQQHGDCIFCDHHDKLYIMEDSGLWRCNYCQASGNIFDFLTAYHALWVGGTAGNYESLALHRGISVESIRNENIVFDPHRGAYGAWVVPTYNSKDQIVYIQWYDPTAKLKKLVNVACGSGKWLSPAIGNCHQLSIPDYMAQPVYMCESRWDRIALEEIFAEDDYPAAAIDYPGAMAFKQNWAPYLDDRDVVYCHDKDKGGTDGIRKNALLLSGHIRSQQQIHWPSDKPLGYDVRDFRKAGGTADQLHAMVGDIPDDLLPVISTPQARIDMMPSITDPQRPTKEERDEVFDKWLHMTDDLRNIVDIACAVKMSVDQNGCPAWIHIVGPPSSGKTECLLAFSDCANAMVVSGVRAATLVSGFNAAGKDPSIIPSLIGGLGIFKDFTEVLRLNPQEKDQVNGYLTGAFDGEVKWRFGNGIYRHYIGRFNLISGVTRKIMGESNASMGERFLSYNMGESSRDQIRSVVRSALDNNEEQQMQVELREVITRYCDVKLTPEDVPYLPDEYYDRLINLVSLVAKLRTVVERDTYRRDLVIYQPISETPARMAKQLKKIWRGLAAQEPDFTYTEDAWQRCIKRIGFNSCNEYNLKIVQALCEEPGQSLSRLVQATNTGPATLLNKINDLSVLGIVVTTRAQGGGIDSGRYWVSDEIMEMWSGI